MALNDLNTSEKYYNKSYWEKIRLKYDTYNQSFPYHQKKLNVCVLIYLIWYPWSCLTYHYIILCLILQRFFRNRFLSLLATSSCMFWCGVCLYVSSSLFHVSLTWCCSSSSSLHSFWRLNLNVSQFTFVLLTLISYHIFSSALDTFLSLIFAPLSVRSAYFKYYPHLQPK